MKSRVLAGWTAGFLLLLMPWNGQAYQKIDLLKNGDFESHLYGEVVPTFWRWVTTEGSGLAMVNDSFSSSQAVEFSRPATGGETVLDNWDHMVPVMAGLDYKFQFAAKGGGTLQVAWGWVTDTGAYVDNYYYYTLSSTWTSYLLSQQAPSNAVKSWVAFRLGGAGHWARVDAATLWNDPGTPTWRTAYINTGQAAVYDNLTQVIGADGYTVPFYAWQKRGVATDPDSNYHYIYFNVNDNFIYGGTNPVAITIEFADNGTDTFSLQYDSVNGQWTEAGTVTKTGTLEWKKKTFYLSDAYFANRQHNGFSDFRICDMSDGFEIVTYVAVSDWDGARINDNHLEINGTPTFMKIALPLADFVQEDLTSQNYVSTLQGKNYTAMEINMYWNHFETALNTFGSMANLTSFFNASHNAGLKVGLSFGTYAVGGGGTPDYVFSTYDTFAKDNQLANIYDTVYGTNLPVTSIHAPGFNNRARGFMTRMLKNLDCTKVTWYETTVEPMYYPGVWCDYSANGHYDWWMWLAHRYDLATLNSWWSTSYTTYSQVPVPTSSSQAQWTLWQIFRAGSIARWVNEDIQTIRNAVGEKALVAVDVLGDTDTSADVKRFGVFQRFIELINPNVFQCNWHWVLGTNNGYDRVYDACRPVARLKNIALSEHMTLNGSDFTGRSTYSILTHTLGEGNKFGWHLTNTRPNSNDPFTLYNSDWSPKAIISPLDTYNSFYMYLAQQYLQNSL